MKNLNRIARRCGLLILGVLPLDFQYHRAWKGGPAINVLRLIDELEHLIEGSGTVPLTNKKMVDEDQFFVLTQRLQKALPEDIKKATELARKTASVVENANSEAKRMVTDAQNEAQHLVGDARSQSERAIEDARSRSERMIEDARREAERILADAQQHAEQLVSDHAITQTATQNAEKTEQVASREAEDLRRQADDYAYDILDRTETILNKLMTGVQQGKNQIQQPAASSEDNSYADSSYSENYNE